MKERTSSNCLTAAAVLPVEDVDAAIARCAEARLQGARLQERAAETVVPSTAT